MDLKILSEDASANEDLRLLNEYVSELAKLLDTYARNPRLRVAITATTEAALMCLKQSIDDEARKACSTETCSTVRGGVVIYGKWTGDGED